MTTKEFSDSFDTLLDSYANQASFGEGASKADITLNEYEKSVFLTRAQEDIVVTFYNGHNTNGDSFESTEEMRRYLDPLVKTKVYSDSDEIEGTGVSDESVFFRLPTDLAFITLEQVTFDTNDISCYNGGRVNVRPVTQDEYNKLKDNPFRGPTNYKVLRLDSGNRTIELVSKYEIASYIIKYVAKPTPIVLIDLPEGLNVGGVNVKTECMLDSILHNTILERAVQLAIQSKGKK